MQAAYGVSSSCYDNNISFSIQQKEKDAKPHRLSFVVVVYHNLVRPEPNSKKLVTLK